MNCLHPREVPYYPKGSKDFNPHLKKIIPCGKCVNCQSRLRNNWSFRLMETLEHNPCNYFVTLTYDIEHVPVSECGYLTLRQEHLKKFLKKFRDDCQKKYEDDYFGHLPYRERHKQRCPLKYFAIGDYGEQTFRPHYHIIVFNSPFNQQELYNYIAEKWNYSSVNQVDLCVSEHCNYVTKYIVKVAFNEDELEKYKLEPTFRLISRGIGKTFVNDVTEMDYFDNDIKCFHKGKGKYGVPAYFKQLLYKRRYGDTASAMLLMDYLDYRANDQYNGYPAKYKDIEERHTDDGVINHIAMAEEIAHEEQLQIKRFQK